jgi:2'-5' RNA ligase
METALAVPIPQIQPLVGLVRREHTPDGAEGMPAHVTLLYPFADTEVLVAARLSRVREVVGRFSRFEVELTSVGHFHQREGTILWISVEPPHPLVVLTEALVTEFPEHPAYGGKFDSIVPHLTVAVSADLDVLDRIGKQIALGLPIRAPIEKVGLYEHATTGWRLGTQFQLRAP